MTNLDIIKYLALNNPFRLAEFLDDIYCRGWNCGAYAQRENKTSEQEMEFVDGEWLKSEVDKDFFFDREVERWSKAIDNPSIKITYPDNLVIELPYEGKDPNHMWNTDNSYNIINQAIEEIELLETITEPGKYCGEVYDNFRKNICTRCLNSNCMRGQLEIDDCLEA